MQADSGGDPQAVAVMAEQCTGRGRRGVVTAAAPLAASAGAAVLAEGGNAYDAAVTAALAETVLLPSKCGLGGDLVAIVVDAGAADPVALLAIGGAPAGLAAVAASGEWSDTGPRSVGPPAAPAGYAALAGRGRLGRARLAAPAVDLARRGFPWAAVSVRLTRASRDLLARWNPGGTAYRPGGADHAAGDLVSLPGLALVLEEFVARGADLLAGPVGAAVVATVARHGGVLTAADLATAGAEWAPCARAEAAGLTVWTTPAPTHGPSLLDAVAGAGAGDDPGAVYRRAMAAVARRRAALADPSGTSIVGAADEDGTVVLVVHSNSYPRYGSGLVVDGYDLVLANRAGRGFSPEPGHPNFPAPGRRPATTLHAWAAGPAGGRPAWVGGTPGGENQMVWNAQTIQALIDGVGDPGRLVAQPRWEWLPADDGVRVEAGFTGGDAEALRAAAPRCEQLGRWALPCAQQVIAVPVAGRAVTAAADPRTVGAAVGV